MPSLLSSRSRGVPQLLSEVRTRILLLYIAALLGTTAIAIPVFRALLIAKVDARVREDLAEEVEDFQQAFGNWAATAGSEANLEVFIDDYARDNLTEDDNFHFFWIGNRLYLVYPAGPPELIGPDSKLMVDWRNIVATQAADPHCDKVTSGEHAFDDPEIGTLIYTAVPMMIENRRRGTFIAIHLTAGERSEAIASTRTFVEVGLGVVTVAFLLAWLFSYQLFTPVRTLTVTARSISESSLSGRLPVRGGSDLSQLAATFNAMMDRLQLAFESQLSFINDASHELRTPITIIRGHLELMGHDADEQRETLALVIDELDRMTRIVDDLLLLAKLERPDFLRLEAIDIIDFVDEIQRKATVLASRHWRVVTLAKGTLTGDRQRIAAAWLNMIDNAVQHTQETDTIEIGCNDDDSRVWLWVRDTGTGISPEDQARIFNRFTRAANSARRSQGAGLGLAIAKSIAEAHKGRIELLSQRGAGSTFSLIFPKDLRQGSQA
ncbi:MAG: sensor histidine kinase [Elainellaceae cyanobacterium]